MAGSADLDTPGSRRCAGEAGWILWEAEDGFTESTPLEVAREADSWIVYEMGGAPLTPSMAIPARVLVAGLFGMKQPKWLRRMQIADHDEDGFWVVRGWDKEAIVKPMSRIDYPKTMAEVPVGEQFWVTGIANAGDRGIMRVELSLDDGDTWADAELDDAALPPLGPLTWVRWRTQATLDRAGPPAAGSRDGRLRPGAGGCRDRADPVGRHGLASDQRAGGAAELLSTPGAAPASAAVPWVPFQVTVSDPAASTSSSWVTSKTYTPGSSGPTASRLP